MQRPKKRLRAIRAISREEKEEAFYSPCRWVYEGRTQLREKARLVCQLPYWADGGDALRAWPGLRASLAAYTYVLQQFGAILAAYLIDPLHA